MKITEIDKNLDMIISKKAKVTLPIAMKWKWRVLNEYPEDIQNVVRSWACDQPIPKVEYNNVSLERILKGTAFGFMDAVDLLYILSKDPAAGYELFMRSLGRDRRR